MAGMEEDTLYIVIPAYNEEANIEYVIRQWYPIIDRHCGGVRAPASWFLMMAAKIKRICWQIN